MQSSTSAAVEMSPANAAFDASASRSPLLSSRSIEARVGAAVEQQQPTHAAVHHPPLQLRRGDDAQRHAVADVEQRRIRPHAERVVGGLHDQRQVAEVPVDDPPPFLDRGGAAIDARTEPASWALIAARSVPTAWTSPSSSDTTMCRRRWSGMTRAVEVARPAPACRRPPTGSPASTSTSRSPGRRPRSCNRASVAVIVSLSGISDRRIAFGSDRTSVDAISSRWPGTFQSNPSSLHLVERRQRDVDRHAVERFTGRVPVGERQFDVDADRSRRPGCATRRGSPRDGASRRRTRR